MTASLSCRKREADCCPSKVLLLPKTRRRVHDGFSERVVRDAAVGSEIVSVPKMPSGSRGWLEARGVEPLSSKLSTQASTCLAGDLFLGAEGCAGTLRLPSHHEIPSPAGAVTPPSD